MKFLKSLFFIICFSFVSNLSAVTNSALLHMFTLYIALLPESVRNSVIQDVQRNPQRIYYYYVSKFKRLKRQDQCNQRVPDPRLNKKLNRQRYNHQPRCG